MNRTILCSIVLLALVLQPLCGGFSVDIGAPQDGALLGERTVEINGTCREPGVANWTIGQPSGFKAGTMSDLTLSPEGALAMRLPVNDDFNDPALNGTVWTSRPAVSLANYSSTLSSISIWGGPPPGPNDYCRIKTKSPFVVNPATGSRTYTCRATMNFGNDWMGMLLIEAGDGSFAGITWGVGEEHGGGDNTIAMNTWVGTTHPVYIGASLTPGKFYEFKLDISYGSLTGYYRAQSKDNWISIATVTWNYNSDHNLVLGRTAVMGGGGAGYYACMTADWVQDGGSGGFFDDFDDPQLNGTLWSSKPAYSINPGDKAAGIFIEGGPSPGENDHCRIRSNGIYTVNPVREAATFCSRGTLVSGNDWMGMIILHADDGHFAGITWGVGEDYGGEDNVVSLLTWQEGSHPFVKGATLVPGRLYDFRLVVDPPGRVSGFYRTNSTQVWTSIGSAQYGYNATHSVLAGRAMQMGGGGANYNGRMFLDWIREETTPPLSGEFISETKDTECPNPAVKLVRWTSLAPRGGEARVSYRSASSVSQIESAPWISAANGAAIGAGCGRYLQVRVRLSRPDGSAPVNCSSVTLLYTGIKSVRLSIDGATWFAPTGTDRWNATLSLNEGATTITVEALDCTDNRTTSTVRVVVDTLPPEGSLRINGGAGYARDRRVTLELDAEDPSGVDEMIVSNFGDFRDADWMPFDTSLEWTLVAGDGEKTVWAMFRDPLGHVSAVVNASIILDTTAPVLRLWTNGGAPFTRYNNVTLSLDVVENIRLDAVMISESPSFAGAAWKAFAPSMEHLFPPGDGTKMVYGKARDSAGNEGPVNLSSIVLDSTAPVSALGAVPAESRDQNLTINWTATDVHSGVRWSDVQYRDGGGPWTDWLGRTNASSAVFRGEANRTYSFRVRSEDNAGNVEPFPAMAQGTVKVLGAAPPPPEPRPPVVTIISPSENGTVRGFLKVLGAAFHPEAGRNVTLVQVRLDGGGWETASGTTSWSFDIDTRRLNDGPHMVRVRAFDGTRYSGEIERTFLVKNPSVENVKADAFPWWILVLVAAVVAGLLVILWVRGRSK